MSRRTSACGIIDREVAGYIDFDCALMITSKGASRELPCSGPGASRRILLVPITPSYRRADRRHLRAYGL
jgi:hypothetical protein